MLRDSWLKWFERRIQLGRSVRKSRITSRRRSTGSRLTTHAAWIAQELESRTLLTHYIVDNPVDESDGNSDPGDLSLREAIQQANASAGTDVITFDPALDGATLQMTMGPLTVTESLSIFGTQDPITVRGAGFVVNESGPGNVLEFSMTRVGVNSTGSGAGLLIQATNDALVSAYITDSFFHNAALQGVRVSTATGGEARLSLSDVAIQSNGDVTLSPGLSVDVGATAAAESNNVPGKFAAVRLNMVDVQFIDNTLEAVDIRTASGGTFDTPQPISNALFQGNGFASQRSQVAATATGAGSSIVARFDDVQANNAYKAGFDFRAMAGGNVAAIIQDASATGAFADAFSLRVDGPGSTGSASIQNFIGDNAGSSGAEINVTNGGFARINQFDDVSLQNAAWSGLDVNLFRGQIEVFNGSNLNVSGSSQNGFDLSLREGITNMVIDGLTSDNNANRGLQILSVVGAQSAITLNNVSAQGNQTQQPLLAISNIGASLDLDVNGGTITSAGTDVNTSIYAIVESGATANLSFDGLNVNNSTWGAFSFWYNNGSQGNVEITNSTATNAAAVPLAMFVHRGSQVTGNFDGLDVSNSGPGGTGQAIRVDVTTQSTGEFAFNNVTADNSSGRGIAFLYSNASGAITKFDNVSAQNAQQDGLSIDLRASQLTSFNGNGIDVTGAGQSGNTAHDGIDFLAQNLGTFATLNLQNVTADQAAGRGLNLQIPYLSTAQVTIDGFSASNNGLEGVNLAVGTNVPGSVLQNSLLRNGQVNNNGLAAASNGILTRVVGEDTSANITLDNVDAGGNTLSGHDALVNTGAHLTMAVNNGSSANNNFLNGFRFVADGPETTAALTSTTGGNSFDGNNDNGLFVGLTNGVTVSDLTIRAGASNNNENGGVIDIDDLSGVTVNNIFISSGGANFSGNDETGLVFLLDSVLGLGNVTLDGVSAAGNLAGATGVNASIANTTINNLAATNISAQGNNGDGLHLLLDNVIILGNADLTGFTTGGNAGDGVDVNLINGTTIVGTMSLDGDSSSNTGDGVKVTATDATGISIGNFAVSGSDLSVNGNSGNGLTIDFNAVIGIDTFDLSGMVITDNAGDQVFARFVDMPAPLAISFDDALATGPGAGAGTGAGINLIIDNTTASSLDLNRINASNNGGDGLSLTLLNGAVIPATSIDVGTFDNNGEDGIGIDVTDSTATIDVTNSTFQLLGTIASASGNGNDGLSVRLDNADLTMNTVDRIIFNNNGRIGVNIEGATPSQFTSSSSFTNNTITNNGSFGWRGVFNGGNFDVSIGGAGVGNLFDNNTGAGISLDMVQNSIGHMTILENTIINTNDDGDPTTAFQGAGIFVRMLGTANPAQATNTLVDVGGPGLLIQNNRIGVDDLGEAAGNAGTGINFDVEELSAIQGLHIHDNVVDNSGVDGLNFRRVDQVIVNGFQMLRNSFNDSGDDGVEILGQNDDASSMDVTLSDNEIMGNGNDGVSMGVNADAGLNLDMDDNLIVQNGDDGFQMTEVILDISDGRRILGSVTNNVIADNANRGINASAALSGLQFSDNTIGMLTDQFDQVVFLGNGSTGVELNGLGTSFWNRNDIRANGRLVTADRSVGHGFDIQNAGFKDVTLTDNLIRENFQDGIEFHNIQDARFSFTLNMIDNRVQDNAGRGLDVLNQAFSTGPSPFGDARSFITIFRGTTGNIFNSNGEEGIYAVNTSSPTQNQTDFSGTALLQNGSVERNPQLSLIIDHATISNNGSPVNVPNMIASAGVVMRVGSSDARGGLTTSPANQPIDDQFATFDFSYAGDVNGPLTPGFRNGGVFMGLTSSSLHGNFGDDVFIHGYRSTGDPPPVSGTWNDTAPFVITNTTPYGDPLARLDVEWRGNDFDTVDLNNEFRRGTPDGQAGAFYNNADGMFKSRIEMSMPPGPFGNNAAGRRRNAQRIPARIYEGGNVLSPQIGLALAPGDEYGSSTALIGDVDGDGIADIAIGAPGDNTGGADRGAVYIQFLNDDGTIKSTTKIAGNVAGGPTLADGDRFGQSVGFLGDFDGDGVNDVLVGTPNDNTGGADRGAAYILLLNSDGSVKNSIKFDGTTTNGPTLADGDRFGTSVADLGDLDGAGASVKAIAVGAANDDTGGAGRGAVYILFLNADGTVADTTKLASGGVNVPTLANGDLFGSSVTSIGDFDGDMIPDMAVGAIGDDTNGTDRGAAYVLFLNADGTIKGSTKIASGTNGGPTLANGDAFGSGVTLVSDLDGNTVDDLVVGAPNVNIGGSDRGAYFVLLMNADGTVASSVRVANDENGGPELMNLDMFGSGVANIGDFDGDGDDDLAVGARGDDTEAQSGGAAYIILMNTDGTAQTVTKIGSSAGGATPDGGTFLYPGMGESTFRVAGGGSGPGFFAFDADPFTGPFSSNGIGFTGNTLFGELPFGWGAY